MTSDLEAERQFGRDVTTVGDIIGTVPVEDDDDNPYDSARRVLRSDWFARVKREAAAKALDEAADDLNAHFQDLPSWNESYRAGERSDDWMKGATRTAGDAIDRLRARAAEYRADEMKETP